MRWQNSAKGHLGQRHLGRGLSNARKIRIQRMKTRKRRKQLKKNRQLTPQTRMNRLMFQVSPALTEKLFRSFSKNQALSSLKLLSELTTFEGVLLNQWNRFV
mmetsp:Transcript_50706/g.99333  ORF Transcript_50706/g.99333 Transcript_50706/m.99333 type:complete len:102 (-) Transcript_50706:94-399(-)